MSEDQTNLIASDDQGNFVLAHTNNGTGYYTATRTPRGNSLNGFKKGPFIVIGIFVIGMLTFTYVFFHKQTGTWNYKIREWENTFFVFVPSPDKIGETELDYNS